MIDNNDKLLNIVEARNEIMEAAEQVLKSVSHLEGDYRGPIHDDLEFLANSCINLLSEVEELEEALDNLMEMGQTGICE